MLLTTAMVYFYIKNLKILTNRTLQITRTVIKVCILDKFFKYYFYFT